uniref:Low density lipoprotein receptor-related protein 10 n=1 Tax=Tetraodon nigroviridis TaxID=99883 RepID=H3D8K0_TETNG
MLSALFIFTAALFPGLLTSPKRIFPSVICGRSPQVLESRDGEIRSSSYYSWSYRYGSCYDCWIIKGSEGEPVVLSFSQFSARCRKEWVSIRSSDGGEPVLLCGSKLPKPMEFPGGNITVTHHFLPHLFPVSSFLLSYARDTGECPLTSFECLGGRCLPLSWRCNGRVECLDEGTALGTDEQGCGAEEEPTESTANTSTWPCGGLLQTFYGTFSPPALRGPALFCVWTLDPQDSRPLRLDLQQLVLGPGDKLTVYSRGNGKGDVLKTITSSSNYKSVQVESTTGLLSLAYETLPGSEGNGFNATFHVGAYCPPWGYTQEQMCDGKYDCPETGRDEKGCKGCGVDQFVCGPTGQRMSTGAHYGGRPVCYPAKERCNYQLYCSDGSDERDCTVCQPGTFHCDSDRCVFESWRCDGQVDCKDGTDELNCTVILPRKVITAATVGSLVCGLLLVIAMGCTCKLYSLRTREYSSLFAPISRQEAELIQQQAPPSYGQLIAQGIIPPVEDFPTENPNETSSLSLRGILQLLRQDPTNSPHRRRRPRFVRRAVRRMRRWGLMPRASSRPSQPPNGGQQPSEAGPSAQQGSRAAPTASSSAVQQQGGGRSSPLPPPQPPPVTSTPPPPYAPPAPPAATPPVVVPSSGSTLASIFHTLGLNIFLFRASPSSSSTNSMALSDDDVLLIPLTEDAASEDDVPMLT